MTKLDAAAGESALNTALDNVTRAADPEWMAAARTTVLNVAFEKDAFTTDDVWAAGLAKPSEPRALGGVMRVMAKEGLIVATGQYVQTAQASRHRAPIRVWRRSNLITTF